MQGDKPAKSQTMKFNSKKSSRSCQASRSETNSKGLLGRMKVWLGDASECDDMATGVAVTKAPATQSTNQKLGVHDGKDKVNSPQWNSNLIGKMDDSGDANMTSKKGLVSQHSGTEQGDVTTSTRGLQGSPVRRGKMTGSREDVGKDDSAGQESLPNGDYAHRRAGSAANNNISCYCPDGPRTRPAPPAKHSRPIIPPKPQLKGPPPKLPPKPPHLLQYRSPSSDSLTVPSSLDRDKDTDVTGKDRRSQSVSVVQGHHSPQREDSQETNRSKRPVPAPRKSLPNIFADLSPPAGEMKSTSRSDMDQELQKAATEVVHEAPVPEGHNSVSPTHEHREAVSPDSQSGQLHDSPVRRQRGRETATKSPRRTSSTTRHVRVRERAAIFEKLIEVETTRNRDSQLSEPRSRTSSRASDCSEVTSTKLSDSSGSILRSGDRYQSYANMPGQELDNRQVVPPGNIIQRKDIPKEDDNISVTSISSDNVFLSPQSSIRSLPRHPPTPNLSEDEDSKDLNVSYRESDYTDVVIPDSGIPQVTEESKVWQSESEYTDVVLEPSTKETDYTNVAASEASTSEDVEQSEMSYRESDYTDVVVPDSGASQDPISPKVALVDVTKPSPGPPRPRFRIPVERDMSSDAPAPDKREILSPDHSLAKPFHGSHSYRNVTPLFCIPPKRPQPRDRGKTSGSNESLDRGQASKQSDDAIHRDPSHDQEGTEIRPTDNAGKQSDIILASERHPTEDVLDPETDRLHVAEDTEGTAETSDMLPSPRRRDQRSKSHPATRSDTEYEVWLPDSIDPSSLARRNGAMEVSKVVPASSGKASETLEGSEDIVQSETDEDEHSYEDRILPETENIGGNQESDSSDLLCNRSRRQRFAVKKRDSNVRNGGRKKWQHESAPASLGGLERQEAVTEPPEDVPTPTEGSNRLSQVSSAGSTISSLISNVSIEDADQLSSDEEDYEDVEAPPSNASDAEGIPPLPPSTEQATGKNQRDNARQLSSKDVGEDDTYSTLYDCSSSTPAREEQQEENEEEVGKKEEESGRAPIEIEMQPLRSKSPHSPEKDRRRKAFEFHIPLFLQNSSSIESSPSVSHTDDRSGHPQASHSEDSDVSSDYIDEVATIPGVSDGRHSEAQMRGSSTLHEQAEDNSSVESGQRVSRDSLNRNIHPELRDLLRRRRERGSERGRPLSEYDRPVSSVSTEYDRPVSCISTDYDRPISSTSADYISVLDSFHEDGKKDEDSEGFSFTWTLDQGEEGSQDDSYRPKSEEIVKEAPPKYAAPRSGTESTQPVPVLPTGLKALKPPKGPRPYSEPSLRKFKRNSLGKAKNLPVPSKEEITEQFCKISRQRSRFVSQEPLFQLYQEDARSRDSYLRLMNISSLESLATFLEKEEARKKEKRGSEPIPIPSQLPEYRVLIPDEEVYRYQSGEECEPENDKNKNHLGEGLREAIYQSAEPVYEPPGELYYGTGDILQNNAIYEPGSLGSSTGEGSGGSGSDVEIPKPYGLMQRSMGSTAVRRSYWSELPEVLNSGLLEQMTPEEKRLQEALFEVITSEASYLRSLNLVVEHFGEAITLQPPTGLLNKVQHHRLFSNIKSVRDASERLLLDLEERQQDSIIISDVCDILLQHFDKGGFNCYIVYCANNQYQIKTLEELRKSPSFVEVMKFLESSPACCSLDLQSFLMLPFQRITRLPLLIEAIRQQAKIESSLHTTAVEALKALRNMAEKCNEEAKRMEMIEEVTQLATQLDFREGVKKMNLSQTTSIVKRGRLHIIKKDNKLLNRGKLIAKAIHVIVFTDKVAVCKQRIKGEQLKYEVFDWCPRNLVQVESVSNPQEHNKLPDGVPNTCKHVFILSFLQNNQKKEVEYAMDAHSEAERERWMDAMHPAKRTQDGETIYESWDCPQVICKQPYEAQDRDELTLDLYDRVDIDKKIEGWYYGTRVSDYAKGWFPASYTQEVVNDHVLARNLKQRHRLLSLCDQHLRTAKNLKK